MTEKHPYGFVVLRYVHDVVTGEFVNVGLVMYSPKTGELQAKTRNTMGRLRGVFPDLDRNAFLTSMTAIRKSLNKIKNRKSTPGLFSSFESVLAIAREAMPADDSSLQWSPVGSGLSARPAETFARLYEQFVARYDQHHAHRKSDDDVWRPVFNALVERNLAQKLEEKQIFGALDDVTFKHAWKNGQWHVYEPVSFDLAESDSIKNKAREWLGHLSAVVADGAAEKFKPHFFVGAPSDPRLSDAYETAKEILRHAPNSPEVFEETQLEEFVAQIEDEVRAHEAGA